MTETLTTLALASGLSWASGLRLYMALFFAGLFGRAGWIVLPEPLQVLQSPWVLAVTGGLLLVEFFADKIPVVDSVWDALHTFIRIPAGAVLGAAALGPMDPVWTTIAVLLGGTLAAGAHFAKSGSRALINTSPEPFSNWGASAAEDLIVVGGLWAVFFQPWILFTFLLIFFALAVWLLPKLWRGVCSVFRRLKTS